MLEAIQEYVSNNSMMILVVVGVLIALVAFVVFKRGSNPTTTQQQVPLSTPPHDLEGMDNVNMVCDLANGVCHPQQMAMHEAHETHETQPPTHE